MEATKEDAQLIIECATAVTFHYYDSITITILDLKTIEDLKQIALKHIEKDL